MPSSFCVPGSVFVYSVSLRAQSYPERVSLVLHLLNAYSVYSFCVGCAQPCVRPFARPYVATVCGLMWRLSAETSVAPDTWCLVNRRGTCRAAAESDLGESSEL